MGYEPEYAEGQILVEFHEVCRKNAFTEVFGNALGYGFLGYWEYGDDVFIFGVPVGEEEDVCNVLLTSYNKFIKYAELRDLKIERRYDAHDKLEEMVQDLERESNLPDDEYGAKLDELIEYIKTLK